MDYVQGSHHINKVSIITVCYNSERVIRSAILSVLGQDYPNIEYIIVDGKSTDRTIEIVKEFKSKISTIISEPDLGIYDAMNKGILAATGDVICMLNSDDLYASPSAVTRLIRRMEDAGCDAVFADLMLVDPDNTNHIIRYYDSSRFHPGRLRYGWMPPHPTFMARRELFEKWGLYSLEYRIAADYEMMVRLLYRAGVSYAHLAEVVVKMRAGGISTSGLRNSWLLNKEIVRACHENGLNTNMLLILMKIPMKLMEYVRRPKTIFA